MQMQTNGKKGFYNVWIRKEGKRSLELSYNHYVREKKQWFHSVLDSITLVFV